MRIPKNHLKFSMLLAFLPSLLLFACPQSQVVDAGANSEAGTTGDGSAVNDSGINLDAGPDLDAQSDANLADSSSQPDAFVLACPSDDVYEPNDSASEAAQLDHPGPVSDTIICDDEDWYAITIPAGFGLGARLDIVGSSDLDLFVYAASDAQTPLDSSQTQHAREDVFAEMFAAATPLLLRVKNNDSARTAIYHLAITFYQNGTCASDTAMEPNDSPAEAVDLSLPAVNQALQACDAQDWYRLAVPADNGIDIELRHDPAEANLRLALFSADDSSTPLDEAQAYSPVKHISRELVTEATDFLLLVENLDYPGPRGDYQLSAVLYPGGYCLDDGHEPNDEASLATPLDTLLAGTVCKDNVDYYSFSLDHPGTDSRVRVDHPGAKLDISLSEAGGNELGTTSLDDDRTTITFTSQANSSYILRIAKAADESSVGVNYNIGEIKGHPPENDNCQSAIALIPGAEAVSGTTINAYDDVRFNSASASCSGSDSDGGDVVYSITVPAGQHLQAKLTMHQDLLLTLVDSCAERCCYAGVDAEGADELNDVVETLEWSNTSSEDKDLFLIVDSRGAMLDGDFTIEALLSPVQAGDTQSESCMADTVADAGQTDTGAEDAQQ